MIRDMARVQTVSERFELQDLLMSHKDLLQNAVRLFSRAEMMFPSKVRQPGGLETVAQRVALEQVHHQMQIAGIPSGASYQALAVALDRYDSIAGAPQSRWPELVSLLSATVSEMNEQIEASPVPGGEWKQVVELLGDEKTAKLLGVSPSSVRRYASSARPTPQGVAERLHSLTLILADLAGSYNDYGIRRWFDRPRAQLGGQTPGDVLTGSEPNSDEAQAISDLAAALVGLGAV